jgi:hypothetical protein
MWLVAKLKSIYNRLGDTHSSLLGPCVSYEDNQVIRIGLQCPYSQTFLFFFNVVKTLINFFLAYLVLSQNKRVCLLMVIMLSLGPML